MSPEQWKKKTWLFRGFVGDEILLRLCGDYNTSLFSDPYETTRIQWKVRPFFFFGRVHLKTSCCRLSTPPGNFIRIPSLEPVYFPYRGTCEDDFPVPGWDMLSPWRETKNVGLEKVTPLRSVDFGTAC